MVTNGVIQELFTRGLFSCLAPEDPHGYTAKLRSVYKSSVGRPELDIDVIRLRVFSMSLTGGAGVWFAEFLYN